MSEWIMSAEDIDDITGGGFTVGQKLVRCKDCKWWFVDENYDGLYRCANDGLIHKPDWFCAEGERKEQNDG